MDNILNKQAKQMYDCELLIANAINSAKTLQCKRANHIYGRALEKYNGIRENIIKSNTYIQKNINNVSAEEADQFANSIILLKEKDDQYKKLFKEQCTVQFTSTKSTKMLIAIFFIILFFLPLMIPLTLVAYAIILIFQTLRYIALKVKYSS